MLPVPQSEVLRQIINSELNIPEFKYVVEQYTNDFITKINFNNEQFRESIQFDNFFKFVKELTVFVNSNVIY